MLVTLSKVLRERGSFPRASGYWRLQRISNIFFSEVKIFALLPEIYPRDFVDYFVRNCFRFLDDIFHTWLISFDIEPFHKLIRFKIYF